ncbi:MAG: hypothetical protein CENE_02527 [Candidatus Celerinatantimonas neptuna]|nr:MAG: hypothetical protein CENE_02527 [Candidatus Celerinatantimonas neptuna]
MARLFLIPLILAFGWIVLGIIFKLPVETIIKGFYGIGGLGLAIIGFLIIMMILTGYNILG